MSNSRLFSGRVKKTPPSEVKSDRYSFLGLNDAEPDFGVPNLDNQAIISDTNGTRSWQTIDLQFVSDEGATSTTPLNVDITGNLTGDVTGDVTGTVSDISNHTTDALTEGSNNLYFTTARARASFSAGTGITIQNGIIDVGQQVGPTDNVAFNDVTVNGTLTTDDITSSNIEAAGNLTVTGNLTVLGNTTTQEADNLAITDLIITVASGAVTADDANGAGLVIDGADATLTYSSVQNRMVFNKGVRSNSGFYGPLTGDVTGNLTGIVNGDLQGDVKVGTATILDSGTNGIDAQYFGSVIGQDSTVIVSNEGLFTGDLTGDVTGNLTGNVTGNLTGDVTGNVTGTVSDISNHDTDALSEGLSNLYFTTARIDGHLTAGTGVTYTTGEIAIGQSVGTSDNVTFNRVTSSLTGDVYATNGTSLVLNSGTDGTDATFTGDVTGNVTGNLTGDVTGNVTGNLTGNTNGTHTGNVTGDVTGNLTGNVTGNVTGTLIGNVTANAGTSTFNNITVNGVIIGATTGATEGNLLGDVLATDGTLVLDNGSDGTDAVFTGSVTGTVSSLSNHDTDALAEGNNLYYTDARVASALLSISVGQLSDVDITTEAPQAGYALVWNNVAGKFAPGEVFNSDDFDTALATKNTDDLSEGSTNLYYTDTRARAAISVINTAGGQGTLSYNDTSGELTYTGPTTANIVSALTGGTGVTLAQDGTISIGQAVATTSNVTFNDMTVSGNLTVSGTTTYIDTTTLNIGDNVITLNADVPEDANATENAGIKVERGLDPDKFFLWNETDDKWTFGNDTVVANTFEGNLTGNITSSGASTFSGTLNLNGATVSNANFDLTGNVTGNLTGNVTGNVTGNLTGDVTGTVSDISNHNTDALAEGSTNLYYTDTRVQSYIDTLSLDSAITFTLGTNASTDFTFSGPGFPTTENDPTIVLVRGQTYIFDNTANYVNHPFKIRVADGGADYTDGVSDDGSGTTTFVVPMDAPSSLYYQCSVHSAMGGEIQVLSQGVGVLADIGDVTLSSPQNGQALVYSSADQAWVNALPGSPPYVEVTSNTNLVSGGQYIVNTNSTAISLTLPAVGAASLGESITIIDGTGNAVNNNITISRNGNKIQGLSENLIVDSNRAAFTLIYYNVAQGWLFKDN